MKAQTPLYTKDTKCQDCYKCLRSCPVKAIEIKNGKASIDDKKCIYCGTCLKNCPVEAKTVRYDLSAFRQMLKDGKKIAISIAPSYVSDFQDISIDQLIKSLNKIGVEHVYETAYGARILSTKIARYINEHTDKKIFISTACTAVTELIQKHFPQKLKFCTPFYSPMITLCKEIKNQLGDEVKIVFVGPCVAKKVESDLYNDLCDLVITFKDLKELFNEYDINFSYTANDNSPTLLKNDSSHGVFYPVDGGMVKSIQLCESSRKIDYFSLSGIDEIYQLFKKFNEIEVEDALFLELLACAGGCINGPVSVNGDNQICKRLNIEKYAKKISKKEDQNFKILIDKQYQRPQLVEVEFLESEIRQALIKVGKKSSNDELNCGGCGYDSCKNFAKALLNHKAESSMCVSYMRQLANNKANKLIQTIPSGVVIVDSELKIVESNQNFAKILGDDIFEMFESIVSINGANLCKLVSFSAFFKNVLETDLSINEKIVEHDNRYLSVSIFTIESHNLVGAIIQDITQPAVQKEQVMKKVEEISKNNLRTVQKIASLLGENAAETQILVSSISKNFKNKNA